MRDRTRRARRKIRRHHDRSLKDKNLRNHIWHADGGFRRMRRLHSALCAPDPGNWRRHHLQQHCMGHEQIDPLFAAYLIAHRDSIRRRDRAHHRSHLDPQEAIEARQRMPPFEMPLVRVHR